MKRVFSIMLTLVCSSLFSQVADKITVIDTRSVNDAPAAFSHEARFHFKQSSVVGLPTSAAFSGVMTFAPWGTDNTGNKHHQIGFNESGLFWRTGNPLSTWDSWNRILTGDANNNFSITGGSLTIAGLNTYPATINLGASSAGHEAIEATTSNLLNLNKNGAWSTLALGGNVGIGTSTPAAKLEVNGDANIGSDAGTINGYGAKLQLLGASSNGDALWLSRFNNGANQTELRVNIGDDFGQSQDMFVVGTNYWSDGAWHPHMAVQASGNVGIGTTTTDAKLTVKGQVHAQEVKVDLNGAVAPDYVFEKDYQLTSLEDIETYIDQNKHLPEIPSAKDMEKNGVQLGEMNMLLLKKIEELTLYVIELKKENEKHQQLILDNRNEINDLKSKIN